MKTVIIIGAMGLISNTTWEAIKGMGKPQLSNNGRVSFVEYFAYCYESAKNLPHTVSVRYFYMLP